MIQRITWKNVFGKYFLGKSHCSYTNNVFGVNFAIGAFWLCVLYIDGFIYFPDGFSEPLPQFSHSAFPQNPGLSILDFKKCIDMQEELGGNVLYMFELTWKTVPCLRMHKVDHSMCVPYYFFQAPQPPPHPVGNAPSP